MSYCQRAWEDRFHSEPSWQARKTDRLKWAVYQSPGYTPRVRAHLEESGMEGSPPRPRAQRRRDQDSVQASQPRHPHPRCASQMQIGQSRANSPGPPSRLTDLSERRATIGEPERPGVAAERVGSSDLVRQHATYAPAQSRNTCARSRIGLMRRRLRRTDGSRPRSGSSLSRQVPFPFPTSEKGFSKSSVPLRSTLTDQPGLSRVLIVGPNPCSHSPSH